MRLVDADKLYPDCMTKNGTLAISQGQIANAPTVEEPERPKGKWVKCKDGYTRCDQCGSRGSAIKARFCHHCGAEMLKGGAE